MYEHDDSRREIVCPTDDISHSPSPTLAQDRRPFSHIFICIYPAPRGTKQNEKIVRMLWLPLTYAYFRAHCIIVTLYIRLSIADNKYRLKDTYERPSHLPPSSTRKQYKSDKESLLKSTNKFVEYTLSSLSAARSIYIVDVFLIYVAVYFHI